MRDLLAFGMGVVVACLALVLTPYSLWWWTALLAGLAIVLVAGCRLLLEFYRPKKLAEIHCTFSKKDIGGCVCPNTRLNRTNTIAGLPRANASSSPTGFLFQPMGTITSTSLRLNYPPEPIPTDRGTYYRVKVSAKNGSVMQCKGRLESLKLGSRRLIAESIDLPFAPAGNADALNKTIHVNSSEHLDFLFISDANKVELTPPNFLGPSAVNWQSLFDAPGDYTLEIRVLSPTAQGAITILFNWTGKRETSRIGGLYEQPGAD